MLGLMLLLVLLPGTGFATLLLLGLLGHGIRNGFDGNPLPAICLLSIPHILVYWGMRMMAGLRTGFHAAIRKKLMVFYSVVAAYCFFWLFAPFTHDGVDVEFFDATQQIGKTEGEALRASGVFNAHASDQEAQKHRRYRFDG